MKRTLIAGLLTASALAVTLVRADDNPNAAAVARGNREFALDLYAKLRGQDGNLFFSPYSISTALAMTRAGAKGDTAAQMDKTLHFNVGQDKLNAGFADLIKQVNGDPVPTRAAAGYQLSMANALWGQKVLPPSRPTSSRLRRTTTAAASTTWTSSACTEQGLARPSTPGSRSRPTTRSRTCWRRAC